MDEAVSPISSPIHIPSDHKQFQELLCSMVVALQISLEEIQDPQHKLLDILQAFGSSQIVLPVNEAILEPARAVWRAPTPKESRKMLFSSHSTANSLVIQFAMEASRQQYPKSTLVDKVGKHLDLLGRKVFTSSNPQFRIANYQALLPKYDYLKYSKSMDFINKFP